MTPSRRHIAPVAVALAVGIVTSGGCSLVVGSADYKIATLGDSGTISDAAPADDVSTIPPDGATPPGSDAASPPDTGSPPPADGGTPPPADGGPTTVCGPNGTVNPGGLPTGDPAFQQLVKSCVLAVSCDPLFFDVTVSDCITRDYLHAYEPNDCLSKITSCDDYYACTGVRAATAAECQAALTADTGMGSCNGSVALSCNYLGYGAVSNCAALGGTCGVYHDSDYATFMETSAGCELPNNCADPTDGSTHCWSATEVYTCQATDTTTNVGVVRQTCPQGSTCQTVNGMASCIATASACTTVGSTCTNGDLTTCLSLSSGSEQYTTSCSATGLQCTAGLGTAACTAAGCPPANCSEGCNGNQLQTCIGGAPFNVDCTTLGFATCSSDTNNSGNGQTYYFCSYH